MSAQMKPSYQHMTSSVSQAFTEPLIRKYGSRNVIWPIVLSSDEQIHSYLYEVNNRSNINEIGDNKPISNMGIEHHFIDYTENPRVIQPPKQDLEKLILPVYERSYDAIPGSEHFSSVDLDYVWYNGENWKSLELTTVWMKLSSNEEAERLVRTFNRRPSWQGQHAEHGIRRQIEAAQDLNLDYWMLVVNSRDGVSEEIVTNGYVYGFPLTNDNVDRIIRGEAPENSRFGSFHLMIDWL